MCLRYGSELTLKKAFIIVFLLIATSQLSAQLSGEDVLILVNQDSPVSRYVANLYRQYHPDVPESQVLSLSGLTDSSGPDSSEADEIISREDYDNLIADSVRQYLMANDLVTSIKVIVTTAGMPYRIEDTIYPAVVVPAASSASVVSAHLQDINAASVESELTCLWHVGYDDNSCEMENRIVNPYQGYRYSDFDLFERSIPGDKSMEWNYAINLISSPPRMEGILLHTWPLKFGTVRRNFNAGDMYLTCRLDGPKAKGQTAIPSVRAMLERAMRASSFDWGVNPYQAVVVIDDSPSKNLDQNRVYNLDSSANYWVYNEDYNQPPDAPTIAIHDDYVGSFVSLTGNPVDYSDINIGSMHAGNDIGVILDRRSAFRTSQADLDAIIDTYPERTQQQGVISLASYGRNGDEGDGNDYLRASGTEPLFNVLNGAVFTSIESFNAVTMFSDAATYQGVIVDFISIGGSGAIGHTFEPVSDAIVDNEFLLHNLLTDSDGDDIADLTFVEAAFTAIPYLSWAEVVIGDPLMRIHYSDQPSDYAWNQMIGDINFDNTVNFQDYVLMIRYRKGSLYSSDPETFDLYNDLSDLNSDGIIDFDDLRALYQLITR